MVPRNSNQVYNFDKTQNNDLEKAIVFQSARDNRCHYIHFMAT